TGFARRLPIGLPSLGQHDFDEGVEAAVVIVRCAPGGQASTGVVVLLPRARELGQCGRRCCGYGDSGKNGKTAPGTAIAAFALARRTISHRPLPMNGERHMAATRVRSKAGNRRVFAPPRRSG